MYRNCPEHPDIDRTLRTGHPSPLDWDEFERWHLMGHCYDGEGVYDEDDNYDYREEEEVYD